VETPPATAAGEVSRPGVLGMEIGFGGQDRHEGWSWKSREIAPNRRWGFRVSGTEVARQAAVGRTRDLRRDLGTASRASSRILLEK
jgi:hypothetical protein